MSAAPASWRLELSTAQAQGRRSTCRSSGKRTVEALAATMRRCGLSPLDGARAYLRLMRGLAVDTIAAERTGIEEARRRIAAPAPTP